MNKMGYGRLFLVMLLMALLTLKSISSVEAQEPPDGIPEGYMIIEGDIVVPDDFYESDDIGIKSAFGDTTFWPNGIVPFIFDANVTQANQNAMLAAMTLWEDVANVDFIPRSGHANYVRIRNSTGNNSQVGMKGGEQIINIVNWDYQIIMAHELAHTLGFWHEQSREDSVDYIQINFNNIQSGYADQFAVRDAADVYPIQAYGLPDDQTYDFDSLMHYDQCSFSIDCPAGATCNCTNTTITVLPPNQVWQTEIGQRDHLSQLDQLTMSFIYPEVGWLFVDSTNEGTQNGTFLHPYQAFTTGFNNAPSGSTLWIQPGSYSAVGVYSKAMTLEAPLGAVVLGP